MAARFDTITFLSDYGTGDEFVGVVKSVIRQIAPHVTVIDLTHEIPAYDVRAGGLTLSRAAQYLCPGVVLAVVDPGVGTERRAIAVEVGGRAELPRRPRQRAARRGRRHVRRGHRGGRAHQPRLPAGGAGPDLRRPRRVRARPPPTSAPACRSPTSAARSIPLSLLPGLLPLTRDEDGALVAEVLWVDRYGNCQLNVDPDEVAAFGPRVQLRWGDDVRTAERAPTYEGIAPGQVGLVVDSYGMLSSASASAPRPPSSASPSAPRCVLAAPSDDAAPAGAPVTLTTKASP